MCVATSVTRAAPRSTWMPIWSGTKLPSTKSRSQPSPAPMIPAHTLGRFSIERTTSKGMFRGVVKKCSYSISVWIGEHTRKRRRISRIGGFKSLTWFFSWAWNINKKLWWWYASTPQCCSSISVLHAVPFDWFVDYRAGFITHKRFVWSLFGGLCWYLNPLLGAKFMVSCFKSLIYFISISLETF